MLSFKKFSVLRLSLILLVVTVMLNLNGIFYLFTGIAGPLSPIILIFSLFLLAYSPQKRYSSIVKGILFVYMTYMFLGLMSLLINNSEIGDKAQQTFVDILKSLILILSLFFAFSWELKRNGNRIVIIFAWSVIASVVLSYLFYLFGISDNITRYRTEQRLSGVFANPNELAAQSLFSLIMIKYLFTHVNLRNRRFYKLLLFTCSIVSLIVMIMSFSRSIILAFVVLLIIQYIFYSKFSILSSILIGGFIILAFIITPIYYSSADRSLQKRMDNSMTLLTSGVNDANTGGRLVLANHAVEIISDQPYLGLGMGYMQKMEDYGGVHNAYLAIWGNAGIVALIIAITALIWLLFSLFGYSRYNRDNTFLFLVLAILINGLTKTGVFEFKINNIIFALALAVVFIFKNENKTASSTTILQ